MEPGTKEELNKYMSNAEVDDFDEAVKLIIHSPVHPSCLRHLSRDSPSWISSYWLQAQEAMSSIPQSELFQFTL